MPNTLFASGFEQGMSSSHTFGVVIFSLLIIWGIAWKGLALWRAARREDKWWFVVFLFINTLGALEILYLYVWSKSKKKVSVKGAASELPVIEEHSK